MHLSTSNEIPFVKTIQLDCEELECVEEKGVAVASACIGASAVSVCSHEHSGVLFRQEFDGHFRCSGLCWASPFGVLVCALALSVFVIHGQKQF